MGHPSLGNNRDGKCPFHSHLRADGLVVRIKVFCNVFTAVGLCKTLQGNQVGRMTLGKATWIYPSKRKRDFTGPVAGCTTKIERGYIAPYALHAMPKRKD